LSWDFLKTELKTKSLSHYKWKFEKERKIGFTVSNKSKRKQREFSQSQKRKAKKEKSKKSKLWQEWAKTQIQHLVSNWIYLNSMVVLVVGKTEWAKRTIHTIHTVHIALTLVRISVLLALNKEPLSQQRFKPWRPPVVLIIRSSSSLYNSTQTDC